MDVIVRFFQGGGAFMYPIAVIMALGFAIAVERVFVLTRTLSENRRDFEALMISLRAGRMKEVMDATHAPATGIAHMLGEAVRRLPHTRRRADLEMAMEEALLEVLPSVERRTAYLASFANVATLLGLLGTVTGIIGSFLTMSANPGGVDPNMLSGSIGEALVCTATGLIIAIGQLYFFFWLRGRVNQCTLDAAVLTNEILDYFRVR